MKKCFLSILSFFFITVLFSFFYVTPSLAAKPRPGDSCTPGGIINTCGIDNSGLVCITNLKKCENPKPKVGDTCTPGTAVDTCDIDNSGLVCNSNTNKCAEPNRPKVGDTCTPGTAVNTCGIDNSGLVCDPNTKTCQEQKVPKVGDKCTIIGIVDSCSVAGGDLVCDSNTHTCQKPNPSGSPPLPPPPSPPCQTWVNGQCTFFDSALGNLSTNPAGFIQAIFAVLLSVSGGIALLLIIRAGYQLMTSQGKPEQMQQGRDQLIAAIVGLVFLIFSFVFLQLIGYDILHIPGFLP